MIQVPANATVVVMHEPISFRNGIEGTAAVARTVLHRIERKELIDGDWAVCAALVLQLIAKIQGKQERMATTLSAKGPGAVPSGQSVVEALAVASSASPQGSTSGSTEAPAPVASARSRADALAGEPYMRSEDQGTTTSRFLRPVASFAMCIVPQYIHGMSKSENLMVRVDRPSKSVIARAARLRGISASDYVRSVVVAHARRELEESRARTLKLSAAEQLAFWSALHEPVSLTARQRELGRLMRGGK